MARRNVHRILLLTALGGAVVALTQTSAGQRIPEGLHWIRSQGVGGAVVFVAVYIMACILFLPGFVLTLGAGAVFGVALGFPLVSLASTLGATLSFLIGRFLARDWIARRIAGHPRFAAVDQALAQGGWRIVGLLRLSPVIPFNLLNYALGLTPISLRDYVIASWIGMMPGTLLYVWLGALAGEVTGRSAAGRNRTATEWTFYGMGLLATVVATVYLTRLARAALRDSLGSSAAGPRS